MGSEQEFASHHHLQPTQAGNLSPGRRLEGNASSVGRETMVTAKSKMDRLRSRSSMRKEGSIRLIAVGEHTELPSQSTNLTDSFTRRAETEARSITLGRFEKSDLGNKLKEIPKFDISEIMLGKRLGRGGFSNVDEIRGFVLVGNGQRQPRTTLPPIRSFSSRLGKITRSDTVAVDDKESRKFIADHCHRNSGDARYAIKMLRKDILESESRIALGLCDLAIESRFLAHLAHPNIIKLRAISSAEPCSGKYFVILDRLRDTLAKRVETWNATYTRLYSFWGRLRDRGGKKRLDFYESRIEKAFDLSSAIDHCHAFNIVHRDIKPDNIGFDVRGDIKIFDFG
jgi:serine/threonine protein kinase